MRLHRIELDSLGSLYGPHRIDLEAALGDAPLFLVSGLTGAGKSTLLDAIALALFGVTPRLPREATAAQALGLELHPEDVRRLVSEGAPQGLARVEWSRVERGERLRFRAEWRCSRLPGAFPPRLGAPERRLERWDPERAGWQVVIDTDRARSYRPVFDAALLGMSAADFGRTVVLAQGAFAAFLRASDAERAVILERLTRTEIYERIGRRASRRMARAERSLAAAEAQRAALGEPLAPGAMAELERALSELETAVREAGASLEAGARAAERRAADGRLRARLEAARAERDRLRAWRSEHRAELEQLEQLADWTRRAPLEAAIRRAEQALASAEARRAETAVAEAEAEQAARAAQEALDGLARRCEDGEARLLGARRLAELETRREAHARQETRRAREVEALIATREAVAARLVELEAARLRAAGRERIDAARALALDVGEVRSRLPELLWTRRRLARGRASARRLEGRARAERAQAELLEARRRAATAERPPVTGVLDLGLAACVALQTALGDEAGRVAEPALVAEAAPADPQAAEAARTAEARACRLGLDAALERVEARRRALAARDEAPRSHAAALDEAERQWRAMAQQAQLARSARSARARAEAALDAARARREAAEQGLEAAATEVADAVADAQALGRALDFADARAELVRGAPCPVCGSEAHPWTEAGAPGPPESTAVDAARARVEALRRAHGERRATRAEAQAGEARAAGELERARTAETRAQALAEAAREAWSRSATLAGLEVEAGPDEIEARRREDEAARELSAAALEALDVAAARAQATRARLDDVLQRWAAAEAADEGLGASARVGRRRARGLEARARRAWERAEADAALLAAGLRAIGFPAALVPEDAEASDRALGQALRAARRTLAWVQRRRRRPADQMALFDAEAAGGPAGAPLDVLDRRIARSQRALEALRARHPAPTATEPVPDVAALEAEQVGLAEALGAARAEAEQRRAALEAAAGARAAAEGARASSAEALRRAIAARDALGSNSPAPAVLPPAAEVERLVVERSLLLDGLARAEASVEALQASLPDELEAQAPDLDARRAELEALHVRRAELLEHLHRAVDGEGLRAEAERALAEAEAEHALALRLYDLVGREEGLSFQRFAQMLELESLLELANRHLERLAPRYSLAPTRDPSGDQRLAFTVRDHHQAGVERSASTLSGGESFLVSLALALALAGRDAGAFRIETLLLDQGFGTLDPEALDAAIDALERLPGAGVQVGVVSHLPAIEARIAARVVVEPLGDGRSRTRIER